MKKAIIGLEKDWMAVAFGIIGVLLIIFPLEFTAAIPYLLGLGLIVHGIISIIVFIKYKKESDVKIGRSMIIIVLGGAILFHNAEAIGPIGAIWAMVALYEVAEEITESFENRDFSVVRLAVAAASVVLALMLMFDPFKHFSVHVQVLGLEMVTYVFIRKRTLRRKNTIQRGQ